MRASDQRFSQRRIQGTERERVLAQLVGIVCPSIATGMLFIQGFENWLRGNPLFWTHVPVVVVFLVAIILYCRRILADNSLAALPT